MTPADLVGLLILALGALILARQRRGKLLAVAGAIAGAVLASLVVNVCSYIAPRPFGESRAGVWVDVGDLRVFQLERPIPDTDRCWQLATLLRWLVAGAGAFTLGILGCAVGSLERQCQNPGPDHPSGHPTGPPSSHPACPGPVGLPASHDALAAP